MMIFYEWYNSNEQNFYKDRLNKIIQVGTDEHGIYNQKEHPDFHDYMINNK